MKTSRYKLRRFLLLTAILWLFSARSKVEATVFVSNLTNLPPQEGIGDIEALFPGGARNGSNTAHFATGPGSSFSINTITLEFLGIPPSQPWGNVDIKLYQDAGSILLGSFGNPVVNLQPTHWPNNTTFIDFSPLGSIYLNPLSHYSVVISVPATSPISVGLLFSQSFNYTSLGNWTMSGTDFGFIGIPFETLIMAVDATAVPEPAAPALLIGGLILLVGGRQFLTGREYSTLNAQCSTFNRQKRSRQVLHTLY